DFEKAARINDWDNNRKVTMLKAHLRDNAEEWSKMPVADQMRYFVKGLRPELTPIIMMNDFTDVATANTPVKFAEVTNNNDLNSDEEELLNQLLEAYLGKHERDEDSSDEDTKKPRT
ncbi:27200_t:CDS:2, partial [Dentiscutata erythropus]